MKDALENRDPVLDMAASIALTHHEKWDGSGYPQRTWPARRFRWSRGSWRLPTCSTR